MIPSAAKQYRIVAGLLNREDVEVIYVCTDSGRRRIYIPSGRTDGAGKREDQEESVDRTPRQRRKSKGVSVGKRSGGV